MERRTVVTGLVVEESELGLGELCRSCGVEAEFVIELVEEGVVEPRGAEPAQWRFAGTAQRRVQSARRLSRDLQVNLAGVALALELLDELEALRRHNRLLRELHERS